MKDRFDYGYSFAQTRQKISEIDEEIRKLKRLLNYANATMMVPEFDMTLGECLVYMSQLNREMTVVERMAHKEPMTSHTVQGGKVEYMALNYDTAECQAKLEWLKTTLAALQIAIDRTNLTNAIEVE